METEVEQCQSKGERPVETLVVVVEVWLFGGLVEVVDVWWWWWWFGGGGGGGLVEVVVVVVW